MQQDNRRKAGKVDTRFFEGVIFTIAVVLVVTGVVVYYKLYY